jgi:hypothetical protein
MTTHICCFDPDLDNTDLDLRTKKGRKKEILRQIKAEGRMTIFWITEYQLRAIACVELENTGKIRRTDDCKTSYPWCHYEVVK